MAGAAPSSEQFAEIGFLDPLRVLSKSDCRRFLRAVDRRPRGPLDWPQGLAATSRAYYEAATHPEILDVISELLGGDVILWGASIQTRAPNEVHPWHSDIETSDPEARAASVWIGLEHTTLESSLIVVPYSHRFGVTVQEVRHENGRSRDETSPDDIVGWARERDGRSELVTPEITDGEALFFDGRLWHGTHNSSRWTRRALLLQYAAPETAIRIPDLNYLDWPFRQFDAPRPPCLIVRGRAKAGVNRVVSAPIANGRVSYGLRLSSRIHPVRLPLEADAKEGWKPYPAFAGSTADLSHLTCHTSVLVQDHSPHPPHTHAEEELLLLLSGEVELELADGGRSPLRPGELVYYPAGFAHTLKTTSAEPATYTMLKWLGESVPLARGRPLPFGRFETARESDVLFEGPTSHLGKLHSHVTVLEPGDGYEPHVDGYDVAIVMLEGEVETIGARAVPCDVIFYPAGEPHGMRSIGPGVARYVVFEFHGRASLASDAPSAIRAFLEKVTSLQAWKWKLSQLLRR